MGIDKSLSDRYPSVIINGSKYHYGRDKASGEYLVEHESIALDTPWAFKEKEDLQAFLINLPESAYPHLRFKLHPDWRAVSSEQRDAYAEQDKALFRAMAAERVRNGTAQSFSMDLEGERGPHEPQRIESRSTEPAIERVERQLGDWKTYHSSLWESGLNEAGRLRVLEGELDWTGVTARDKEAILAREIDFARITPEEFAFVHYDIASGRMEPADPSVAQALFDRSRAQAGPRIESPSKEPAIERVERELRDWKTYVTAAWEGGVSEAEKLRMLEREMDWSDITDREKEAVLAREIDFSGITRDQLNFVYEEIGSDEIDERPARRLFDVAIYERAAAEAKRIPFGEQMAQVRDTTRNLVESIMLDGRPRVGAIVDFGLDSQRHYEALYHAIRNGEVAPLVLDAAMGHGAKLTLLVRELPSNPHKDIQFHTAWDELLGRPLATAKERPLSPGDIANRKDAPEPPGNGPEQERER
jgi:hypothetical protein